MNKVPGASPVDEFNDEEGIVSLVSDIENIIGIPVMGSIPCYCDIQFNRHEYLYSITNMDHPFSQKMHELAKIIL